MLWLSQVFASAQKSIDVGATAGFIIAKKLAIFSNISITRYNRNLFG